MKRRALIVDRPTRLEGLLREALSVDRAEVIALVKRGAVYVDGRRCSDPVTRLGPGMKVMVVLEESGAKVTDAAPPPPPVEVLLEDALVLALNKPSGVTAQPTPGKVGDSLLDLASAHLGYGAGLVHRLDRETSGVTIFGKTADATSDLAAAFREGTAKKEYFAIVRSGIVDRGIIELPLSKDASRPGRWQASARHNGISAVTHFERIHDDGTYASVALYPKTGRTHQLRAHLTGIGFPIVGDALYGGAEGPRCLLHARRLEVLSYEVNAPMPADFAPYLMGRKSPVI